MLCQVFAQVDVVQKAADLATIFNVAVGFLALPGTIYGLYTLCRKLSGHDKTIRTCMRISTTEKIISIDDESVEKIDREIKVVSKKVENLHA